MINGKNRKLKGSVLLTVVSVMALLILFMTGAVTLANSMNNRAHANYSDSQAEYTAKAAIQSFTQALMENDAVAQTVVSMDVGQTITPAVIVNDTGMGNVGYYENGEWVRDRIKIEYVKDNMAYDDAQKAWVPMQVIKITATGKVGKQEKSVSYYIERASVESKSTSIKGFQTLGGGGHQNNGEITGALTMGLEQSGNLEYGFKNDYTLRTDTVFVNGHFTKTDGNYVEFHVFKPNTQYVIMGDFTVRGSNFEIKLDYPYGSSDASGNISLENMTQQSIPYLYVKGNLGSSSGDTKLVVTADGVDNAHELRANAPFNIFAGTIGANTNRVLPESEDPTTHFGNSSTGAWGGVELNGADLYLMKELNDPTNLSLGPDSYLNPSRDGNLYKWSSSVLNGTASHFYSNGGSIYCNHNLHIGNKLYVEGDLVVQGNLYLGGELTVEGDLVVKGTIDNVSQIKNVGGRMYYNGTSTKVVYTVRNIPAEGSLKPDCVKVRNFQTGNIAVENLEVANIPVFGDIAIDVNEVLEGYELVTLCWGGDYGYSFQDRDFNQLDLGYNDFNDFNNNTFNDIRNDQNRKGYLRYRENLGEDHHNEMDIIVKYNEIGAVDSWEPLVTYQGRFGETYDSISYYYVNGDEYTPVKAEDVSLELYVADKNGNPTTEKTFEPTTIYRVNADGTVSDERTTDPYTYYVSDKDGRPTNTIATTFVYYYRVDPGTNEATSDLAEGRYSYYREKADGSYELISEEEAYIANPGMYIAWYDNLTIVPDEFYVYGSDPTGHTLEEWHNANLLTGDGAKSSGDYYLVSSYPGYVNGSVYPSAMTDANITAGDKKIVMSLKEARENIGMNADGTFQDGMYTVNFDSNTVGFKEPANIYTAAGSEMVITKSGTLTGTYDSTVIRVKPKDNTDVINLVMKDCNFTNGASLLIDSTGIVNILFEGTNVFEGSGTQLGISAGAGIYTTNVIDKIKNSGRINETDKMNVIMYGKPGSVLTNNNTGIFCGIAKCPYTEFNNPATQGVQATWKYVMKSGQIWEPAGVNWIGSALFKSAMTNDNFVLLYTNSADGGETISNDGVEGANWYGKYYDAY